jgi:flagellin
MRINHNISAMVTQGSLFKVNRQTGLSLERLSTGLRINRASDDAAGLGVSENLRTQVRGTAQAMRNAQDGIAAISVAEGAANDTLTSLERQYTNQEYRQLIDEIDRIAAVTNYNGMKLISSAGTSANERFGIGGQAGPGSALWIDANSVYGSDSITITIDSLTSNMLGAGAQAGGVANLTVTALTTQTDSVVAIQQLDESIDSVNMLRSSLGALVNRLEHGINNLMISNTNQQAAESLIRDVDFAYETTQFTRNQILMQSGTAMLAQANTIPQSVLSLLGG